MSSPSLLTSIPFRLLQPGDLVFDIGAHIGSKAQQFLSVGTRVVCVEPQPDCAEALRRRFVAEPSVVIVEKGLAECAGFREISICPAATTISTFSERWKHGRFANFTWDSKVAVEVTTLDALIDAYGIPNFCKIDVEGYEYNVIRGLSWLIPSLSFEFTSEFLDAARACIHHLQSLGFARFNVGIAENTCFEFSEWCTGENLFEFLSGYQQQDLWGDIYAQANPCQNQGLSKGSVKYNTAHIPGFAGANNVDIIAQLIANKLWTPGTPLRLHLGCGMQYLPGYINIDFPQSDHAVMDVCADYCADITMIQLPEESVDEIRLHHVFEHFNRVTALGLLIKWHGWLKIGGQLLLETPDLYGSSKTLLSDVSLATKMGVVRHLSGDQVNHWSYHVDHWFPERFQHTLTQLGFNILELKSLSWSHEPYLSNCIVRASKNCTRTLEDQLVEADKLLMMSTVGPSEKSTLSIWRQQLRSFLFSPAFPVCEKQTIDTRDASCFPSSSGIDDLLKSLIDLFSHASSQQSLSEIHNFNQRDRDSWVSDQASLIPSGCRVLDVGAGTCPYRELFAHCNYNTHDFMLYKGTKLGNTTAYGNIDICSDILDIPVGDASFDVILCTEVLEHVPLPIDAVFELSRILKPSGRLLLTAPLMSGLHQLPYHYYGGFTPEWYNYVASKCGLQVIEIIPNGGASRLLAQECARIGWSWKEHGHLHGDKGPAIYRIFSDILPRFLFGLESHWFNDQFTVGYHVVLQKTPLSSP